MLRCELVQLVQGLTINEAKGAMMKITEEELKQEKADADEILAAAN